MASLLSTGRTLTTSIQLHHYASNLLLRPRILQLSVTLPALFANMPPRRSTRSTASRPADDQPAQEAPPAKKPRVSTASKKPSSNAKDVEEPEEVTVAEDEPQAAQPPELSNEPKKRASRFKDVVSDSAAAPTASFRERYGDNLSPDGLPRTTLDLASLPEPYDGPEAIKQMGITPRVEGDTRIATWNIVSFRSSDKKGMFNYLKAEDADIVVLLETKVNEAPMMHPGFTKWPYRSWAIDSSKKGYAGVAVWSKIKPIKTTVGIPPSVVGKHHTADDEQGASTDSKQKLYDGRIITLEFERYFVLGFYAPNGGEGLKRLDGKVQWFKDLTTWLYHLHEQQPNKKIIMTGDLNVVLDQRDLSNGHTKWDKAPGFTTAECSFWRKMVQPPPQSDTLTSVEAQEKDHKVYNIPEDAEKDAPFPFVDVWRQLHPDAVGHFSFFAMRGGARPKGIGWRLDSFLVSGNQYKHVDGNAPAPETSQEDQSKVPIRSCEIRYNVFGTSDHVPVVLDVADKL